MNSPVTQSEVDSVAARLATAGINPKEAGRAAINKASGGNIGDSRARAIQRHLRAGAFTSNTAATVGPPLETHEVAADTWQVTIPRTRICTLEQLIEHAHVDTTIWVCEKFLANKWEVGSSDGKGGITVEPLFQVKAWFKRNIVVVATKEEIALMIEEAKAKMPRYPKIIRPKKSSGVMLELGLYDHHFGKLAWSPETGWPDYDVKIAEALYFKALEAIIARTSSYAFDKILFVVGNDLMNADNKQDTTTAGTPQTCDSRYQKVFTTARRASIAAIDRLREIAPVRAVMVAGNHDSLASFHMGDALGCWYNKCQDIEIDNTHTSRKYYEWGKVLLMFTHGDKGKLKDLPLTMASEAGEAWGRTQFREIHTGDRHTTRLEEHKGIRVRILPSLCPPDEWHASMAFVGNIRSSEAFVWDKEEGHIGGAVFNLPNKSTIQIGDIAA